LNAFFQKHSNLGIKSFFFLLKIIRDKKNVFQKKEKGEKVNSQFPFFFASSYSIAQLVLCLRLSVSPLRRKWRKWDSLETKIPFLTSFLRQRLLCLFGDFLNFPSFSTKRKKIHNLNSDPSLFFEKRKIRKTCSTFFPSWVLSENFSHTPGKKAKPFFFFFFSFFLKKQKKRKSKDCKQLFPGMNLLEIFHWPPKSKLHFRGKRALENCVSVKKEVFLTWICFVWGLFLLLLHKIKREKLFSTWSLQYKVS